MVQARQEEIREKERRREEEGRQEGRREGQERIAGEAGATLLGGAGVEGLQIGASPTATVRLLFL